jgi:hypothetical protein
VHHAVAFGACGPGRHHPIRHRHVRGCRDRGQDYGDFDNASNLNRPDVFRLNIGVSRDAFRARVGHPPSEDSTAVTDHDFAALDRLMPHPVYARQSWLCVLNPGPETFEAVKPLLAEAYAIVAARHASSPTIRD